MENVTAIITITVSVVGFLLSVPLFQRGRRLQNKLKGAVLNAPSESGSIQEFLDVRANEERLNMFYSASKYLGALNLAVFGIGVLIVLTFIYFYIDLDRSNLVVPTSQTLGVNPSGAPLLVYAFTARVDAGSPAQYTFPIDKVKAHPLKIGKRTLLQVDERTSRLFYVNVDLDKTRYLVASNGEISEALVPQVVLTILLFMFLCLIFVTVYLSSRLTEAADGFPELRPS